MAGRTGSLDDQVIALGHKARGDVNAVFYPFLVHIHLSSGNGCRSRLRLHQLRMEHHIQGTKSQDAGHGQQGQGTDQETQDLRI